MKYEVEVWHSWNMIEEECEIRHLRILADMIVG